MRSTLREPFTRVFDLIEDRKSPIEIGLRNRVEFVVVTLRTAHRQPQPHRGRGVHPIDHALQPIFLRRISLPFGLRGVAMEPRGDQLIGGRLGQKIARQLLDGKLIKRLVALKRPDHPIPIGPNRAGGIVGKSPRIRIPREIQPVLSPALRVVSRGHQAVDHPLVCLIRGVSEKVADLRNRRGQTGEIEGDAANQCRLCRFRGGRHSLCLHPREDKKIQWVPGPIGPLDRWQRGRLRR